MYTSVSGGGDEGFGDGSIVVVTEVEVMLMAVLLEMIIV